MTAQCYNCGQDGHLARDCQWEAETSGRPAWCGECDKDTRLVDHGSYMRRCPRCWAWPAKGTQLRQLLPQHRRCGGCGQLVMAWDKNNCGAHLLLDIDSHGRSPYRETPGAPPPTPTEGTQRSMTTQLKPGGTP